jgi:hypothetical protein
MFKIKMIHKKEGNINIAFTQIKETYHEIRKRINPF